LTRKGYAKENDMNRFQADEGIREAAKQMRRTGPPEDQVRDIAEIAQGDLEEAAFEVDDIDCLKSELERLRKQAADDREQLLRVSAEFENYKKRSLRHMEDFKKYANEALLKELLTVVDNLERAVTSSKSPSAGSPDACIVEGVEMTLKEIMRVLEKFHVTPIDALGKPFDPVFHEAVMREETDAFPENTVCNVLQKGYMIHDRLLRPAMVSVSCG
jgi:molecular chaperone GrpE